MLRIKVYKLVVGWWFGIFVRGDFWFSKFIRTSNFKYAIEKYRISEKWDQNA